MRIISITGIGLLPANKFSKEIGHELSERIAVATYREIVKYFGQNDPTSRTMRESILAQEEEHAVEPDTRQPRPPAVLSPTKSQGTRMLARRSVL